jgi:hypothetical protein
MALLEPVEAVDCGGRPGIDPAVQGLYRITG